MWNNETGHPAYERILTELAPDEGRILMLLLRGGPQPTVDVRTGGPVGLVRTAIEVVVVATGWLLGGTLGVVTVLYALTIGPLVHMMLPRFAVAADDPAG